MLTLNRRAPAKINLYLRVVGRRSDGYHLLDSLFLPLQWYDDVTVTIEKSSSTRIDCVCSESAFSGEKNLAARAADAYLQRAQLTAHVALHVQKSIWHAAGLGGGSSDAAAVLLALQSHFSALDDLSLADAAVKLGADVPFFLRAKPARATGIGETLTLIDGMPALHLVLCNPGLPLSTPEVFRALNWSVQQPVTPYILPHLGGQVADAVSLVHNDLLPPAKTLCPQIADLLALLSQFGALGSGLSGSGPTVFGIFSDAQTAKKAAQDMTKFQPNLLVHDCQTDPSAIA